ncbi:futalosine hydrolase [Desulfohalovibrio reitneri]|uniref:futalosine hydrolase n=1 Tax=Desulfohalovibrio reitneri TaxID=1307759 RepID=UPI0004A73C02|nr:futalosine hydrolase [Desulfohalovibrio reitneri]
MPLILACATERELDAALGGKAHLPERPGELSELPDEWPWNVLPMAALITGVGPSAAAFSLGRAIGEMEPESVFGVLNMGLGGTFRPEELPLGSLAVATAECFPEFGLHGVGGLAPEGLGFGQGRCGEEEIFQRLPLDPQRAAGDIGLFLQPHWPRAAFATVAGVSGCPERAELVRRRTGASVESMEGFALALGCAGLGIPFLEVRAVSNTVGSREDWDLEPAFDALHTALVSLLS